MHGVALKPGKPLWFGVLERDARQTLVFGLPGNREEKQDLERTRHARIPLDLGDLTPGRFEGEGSDITRGQPALVNILDRSVERGNDRLSRER